MTNNPRSQSGENRTDAVAGGVAWVGYYGSKRGCSPRWHGRARSSSRSESPGGPCRLVDVFTPYAVHGMEDAMGLRAFAPSLVCFAAGLCGATLALVFEAWSSQVSWGPECRRQTVFLVTCLHSGGV